MKSFFNELFEYSHESNQKLAGMMLKNSGKVSEKSIRLFNHILNAHQIWNNRIDAMGVTFGVWEFHSMEDYSAIDRMNFENSLRILSNFELTDRVKYVNSKGDSFEKELRDILFHIINHSTYHRGQIASNFRETGLEPLISDFIYFKE